MSDDLVTQPIVPQNLHNSPIARMSTPLVPTHTKINLNESSFIHVGPEYVAVTQKLDNIPVARGQLLGFECVSPENTESRYGTFVFVCWAIVIASAILICLIYIGICHGDARIDLDIHKPWYIRRYDWYAVADRGIELQKLPVSYVIIGHSAAENCFEKYDCIKKVLKMQNLHQTERRWDDIGPNFLVGGSGEIIEGRGANLIGTMVSGWNLKSISIMFMGNYAIDQVTDEQFDNIKILLQELVRKEVLTVDYALYGNCQVIGGIISPGMYVMDNLFRLDHWNSVNKSDCLRS